MGRDSRYERRNRSKTQRARRQREVTHPKMDRDLANAICDDLPDGAYFAMMEELTGLDAADLAEQDE